MKDLVEISIKTLGDTKSLAKKFSTFVKKKSFICLYGDLGTGKTTFVRFLLNEITKKKIKVLSPTFSLVQTYYLNNIKIWHFDFYRVIKKNEVMDLDFYSALEDCVIVEWPEIIKHDLPSNRIELKFHDEQDKKIVEIKFFGNTRKIKL